MYRCGQLETVGALDPRHTTLDALDDTTARRIEVADSVSYFYILCHADFCFLCEDTKNSPIRSPLHLTKNPFPTEEI